MRSARGSRPTRSRFRASAIPSVGKDSLALAPGFVVPGLASLVSIPLVFGALGPSQYGVYALILAVANGVPQLTTGWLEAVVVRFAHRPGFETSDRAVVTAVGASCVIGGGLAVVLIPGTDAGVIASTLLLTGVIGAYLLAVARLQSSMRFATISRGAVVRAVVANAGAVVLGWMTGSAAAAAFGLVAGFGVGVFLMLVDIPRKPGQRVASTQPEADHDVEGSATATVAGGLPDLAGYGFGSLAVAGSLYVLSTADRFVLSVVRPLDEVGIYAATYGIVDLVFRLIPSIVFVVVRPRLFRAWDRGDRAHVLDLAVVVLALLGWVSAALSLVVVLIATASGVLPIDARLAGPIAAGLAAMVAANGLGLVYGSGLRQARLATHLAVAAAVNIAMNIAVAPILGAYGASLATLVGYLVLLGLNIWGLRSQPGASRSLVLYGAICLAATVGHGLVAGTAAWPFAATVTFIVLLALSPILGRHARSFVGRSERAEEIVPSGSSARPPEKGELS